MKSPMRVPWILGMILVFTGVMGQPGVAAEGSGGPRPAFDLFRTTPEDPRRNLIVPNEPPLLNDQRAIDDRRLYQDLFGQKGRTFAPGAGASRGQDYRATILLQRLAQAPGSVSRLDEIAPYIASCLQSPDQGGRPRRVEITVQLAFNRNGEILGEPRITFITPGLEPDLRNAYQKALLLAVSRCTPLPLANNFGGALAGRFHFLRFVDDRTGRTKDTFPI